MEVLVLNVGKPYDFTTDAGQQLKGFKVNYSPLAATVAVPEFMGKLIVSKSLSPDFYFAFSHQNVPGIYEFDFQTGYSATGKLIEVLKGVKYKREVKLEDIKR